jgi:hypothetical protein
MVKKKSSKKKVSYNNKAVVIGVIVLVILFVLAFAYQGSREDEEGLGNIFGMWNDHDMDDDIDDDMDGDDYYYDMDGDDDNGDDEMDGDDYYDMDGDDYYDMDGDDYYDMDGDEILCDGNGEPEGCELKAGPTCKTNHYDSFPGEKIEGWCKAEKGNAKACCPEGWKCFKKKYAAWCGPKDKNDCKDNPPRTKFCSASKDTACCLPDIKSGDKTFPRETCDDWAGYAWCKPVEEKCNKRFPEKIVNKDKYTIIYHGKLCGFYCCDDRYQKCQGNGPAPDSCTLKSDESCPTGYSGCNGVVPTPFYDYDITICCHTGKCVESTTGPPTCLDNQPYR